MTKFQADCVQGRTNKLVDGCYSFWQGGIFPLLHKMLSESPDSSVVASLPQHWLFDQGALQEYLLICCQVWNVDTDHDPDQLGCQTKQHIQNGAVLYCDEI